MNNALSLCGDVEVSVSLVNRMLKHPAAFTPSENAKAKKPVQETSDTALQLSGIHRKLSDAHSASV